MRRPQYRLDVIELASQIKPAAISFAARLPGDGIDTTHPQWFEKALDTARQGMLYSQGIGVKQDLNEALVWLKRASDITRKQCFPCEAGTVDEALADEWLQKAEALKAKTAETADGKGSR